jgi:hypothetical protein
MKTPHALSAVLLLSCAAQPGGAGQGVPSDRLTIDVFPGPHCTIHWDGRPGRTYFVQASPDLSAWIYDTGIHHGSAGETFHRSLEDSSSLGGLENGPRLFCRLRFRDIPVSDPGAADFDLDGLSNAAEIAASPQTDPLDGDTDGDGTPDGQDSAPADPLVGGDPAMAGDDDGDGISNCGEILLGTSPTLADTDADGVPDNLDAFPLDSSRSGAPAPDPADSTGPVITLESPANAVPVSP